MQDMVADEAQKPKLTLQETREILTPFAFKIDEDLYGTPLAKSWKRGVAMLIDLMLIAFLSSTSGEVLALVIAITFFRLGSNSRAKEQGKTKGKKRRFLMRLFAAFILFVTLAQMLPQLLEWINNDNEQGASETSVIGKELDLKQAITLGVKGYSIFEKYQNSNCLDKDCWYGVFEQLPQEIHNLELPPEQAKEFIEDVTSEINLDDEDKQALQRQLINDYEKQGQTESNTLVDNKGKEPSAVSTDFVDAAVKASKDVKQEEDKKIEYSIIKHAKALIDDLGLGFGWAAFYFTVFTSVWRGQTPGKKFLGIRVMQLDGRPLSLMDSFGRYGGYGAGIATGLLGFLQIFWDPNRQAIQDKISATVVVDNYANVPASLVTAVHDGKVTAAK